MTLTALLMSADSVPSASIDAPPAGAFDAMHLAFPSLTVSEIALAIHRLLQAGYAIVPIHPPTEVLTSMLRRHQIEGNAPVSISLMAKLHEEVVGLGTFNRLAQDLPGTRHAEHSPTPAIASAH